MSLAATGFFDGGKDDLQEGKINLLSDDIRVWGINSVAQQLLSQAGSNFVSEVIAANRTHAAGTGATQGVALLGKTVVGKTFDANDLAGTFLDPNNGNGNTTTIIISKWDGVAEASSRLIAFIVLPQSKPQDGTDDDLTFSPAGIWDL